MERKTFIQGMALFAATWPDRAPTKDTLSAYWLALSDLADDVFTEACKRCLRECTFYPKPAEILARAKEALTAAGAMPLEPEPAWEEVLVVLRNQWSPYKSVTVVYSDPAIEEAVRSVGGLGRIAMTDKDELPFVRKDFLERYRILRQRRIDTDPSLMRQSLPAGDPALEATNIRQLRERGTA